MISKKIILIVLYNIIFMISNEFILCIYNIKYQIKESFI
jgi:hypothetical protein